MLLDRQFLKVQILEMLETTYSAMQHNDPEDLSSLYLISVQNFMRLILIGRNVMHFFYVVKVHDELETW